MADADERLLELVRDSPFPLFLVRLSDSRLLELSRSFEAWSQRSRSELIGERTLDFVADPVSAKRSLDLLAAGVIDAYTRRTQYRRPDGSFVEFEIRWTAHLDESPPRNAIAMVLSESTAPSAESLERPVVPEDLLVMGTVCSQWKVDRITTDVFDLLGYQAADLIDMSALDLVHPEDVSSLLLLVSHASERPGTCGRVRLQTRSGDWLLCHITVRPLAPAPGSFAFVLSPVRPTRPAEGPRIRELEDHLRHIAREIAASGVAAWSTAMPTAREVPELSRLTTREYDIVVRLAAGERVPTIARSLFLSESTVRNHLTAVYRKFSVHSQSELLARLHSVG
jgi:PAS domain S-box-containing protein